MQPRIVYVCSRDGCDVALCRDGCDVALCVVILRVLVMRALCRVVIHTERLQYGRVTLGSLLKLFQRQLIVVVLWYESNTNL